MDLVAATRGLADAVLRPAAERVDTQGVPRSHIDALAGAGLLGIAAPTAWGGCEAPPPVAREIIELLAAADCSTWFVWTQHHTPVRTLVRGDNDGLRERWLRRLATGDALAGVAFTHLRRTGAPPVRAERATGGWRVDGDIAWLTSWGLADAFLVGAQSGDDVVWFLAPLHERTGVTALPLHLMAMAGTATVRLRLDGLRVDDADVALVEPLGVWRASDAAKTADVNPAVFGVIREAVDRLRAFAVDHADSEAAGVADVVDRELTELRLASYALIDGVPAGERVGERLRLRADAHTLSCRATAALVAAWSGRAVALDSPAQRLAREALFLLVQGQTAAVRATTLRRLAHG